MLIFLFSPCDIGTAATESRFPHYQWETRAHACVHEPLTRRKGIGAPRKTKSMSKISSTRCGRKCVTIKPRLSQARMVLQPALADAHRGCDQHDDRDAEHNDARCIDKVVPHDAALRSKYLAHVSQMQAASMCSLRHCCCFAR